MITKARKWIMVASLMLTMCFAINNSTSAKAAVVTEVATQNLKLNNAINEAKNEYEGDVIGVGTIELGSVTLSSNSYQVASTKSIAENGNIFGNGVRLRKLPKKTGDDFAMKTAVAGMIISLGLAGIVVINKRRK